MTPWKNERWATAPTNDGRNFAPAHRWDVVAGGPLCYGLRKRNYHAAGMPCGDCDAYDSCPYARLELRKWANGEARTAALLRVYIREAHELREENRILNFMAFEGPFSRRELAKRHDELRHYVATLEAENEALRRIIPPLNVVTARHRHGQPVEAHHLTALANRQIDVEQAVREAKGERRCPDCGHRLDTEECGCLRADAGAIQTDDDCEAALVRIENLWGAKTGTPDGDVLDVLLDSVVTYEAAHHLVPEPDKGGGA